MSTRGCYVFQDAQAKGAYVVYKHCDNYPSGGIAALVAARAFAWELPRFEADEAAASFVAANKKDAGNVRLCGFGSWQELAPVDIEYLYIVRQDASGVTVQCLDVLCNWQLNEWTQQEVFVSPWATIEHATHEGHP